MITNVALTHDSHIDVGQMSFARIVFLLTGLPGDPGQPGLQGLPGNQ